MASLELISVEFDKSFIIPKILPVVSEITGFNVSIINGNTDIDKFYNPDRGQYDGGKIIEKFESKVQGEKALVFTDVDLFIPIFTFVFGLAKLNGRVGIISGHRLRPEFYGLPGNEQQFIDRVLKETVHEFGHLINLRHCNNYYCVMSSSNTADDLDIKNYTFCSSCKTLTHLI